MFRLIGLTLRAGSIGTPLRGLLTAGRSPYAPFTYPNRPRVRVRRSRLRYHARTRWFPRRGASRDKPPFRFSCRESRKGLYRHLSAGLPFHESDEGRTSDATDRKSVV